MNKDYKETKSNAFLFIVGKRYYYGKQNENLLLVQKKESQQNKLTI